MEEKYELKVNGSWVTVSLYIFRSAGWPRRMNGKEYHGPVYYLGTEEIARQS
jgi:hypothetical protein